YGAGFLFSRSVWRKAKPIALFIRRIALFVILASFLSHSREAIVFVGMTESDGFMDKRASSWNMKLYN
ncbi:MAG: hypothetical protein LBQ52_08630, partial [Helicobacteraceae bacterium]|nr:hypothetical protein [Helicobacteraceae bacterium]